MTLRLMTTNDITEVMHIERTAWNDSAASRSQILSRLETFPEGSIVVENDAGNLVGYASAQLVNQISTKSWSQQTDGGFIVGTHKLDGKIAYGVSMSALPEGAKYGVGAMVIAHYYDVFIKSGRCSVLCLGTRLPGFSKWQSETNGSIRHYITREFNGYSRDPELRLYQKNGFQLLWPIEGYFQDSESLDYGAMIVQR